MERKIEDLPAPKLSEEAKAWLAVRKAEALKIDPKTAIVDWSFAETMDPYGVEDDFPSELSSVGRQFFCRRPDGDVWVSFYDLPIGVAKALHAKIKDETANWEPSTQQMRQDWAETLGMRLYGDPPLSRK